MTSPDLPGVQAGTGPRPGRDEGLARLLARVAQGDQVAFEAVYDQLAHPAYGLIRKVVRDPA